jgi:glutathione S-transferase
VIEAFTARTRTPSFAPPFLVDGDVVVGQTAAILFYLGPKLGLAPRDPRLRLWAHQIQLTIADFVVEAHDSHHPVGSGLYYEQQKREAKRRAREFREERAPKFLGWFETVLRNNIATGHRTPAAHRGISGVADLFPQPASPRLQYRWTVPALPRTRPMSLPLRG